MSEIKNCIYGLVIGDAMGVPIEEYDRKRLLNKPVTKMLGWGNYFVPEGSWSDDTSMAVAAMSSVTANNGKIDFDDVMKQFLNWWDRGQYTSLEFPFGLGGTVDKAFRRYRSGVPALECGGRDFKDKREVSLD